VGDIAESGKAIGRRERARSLELQTARTASRHPLVPAAVCGALLVALAVLVASGSSARFDHFMQDHLSPLAHGPQRDHPFLLTWLNEWLTIAMSIAAPFLSTAAALLGCLLLALRGRRDRAIIWLCAYGAGLLIEVVGKLTADPSYPSGHTLRAMLLAGLASELWPRRQPWFWGFAAFVILGIILKGTHPPSDIVGGVLAATMLLLVVSATGQKPSWRPRSQSSRT